MGNGLVKNLDMTKMSYIELRCTMIDGNDVFSSVRTGQARELYGYFGTYLPNHTTRDGEMCYFHPILLDIDH